MNRKKILLVDDEQNLLNNFKQILEFENFNVTTATNGNEAYERYEREKPDLIICDIMMPELDGIGFIDKIRKFHQSEVPFIFLTAKSSYDDLRKGMSIGADDYLVKPVKSVQLIEAINTRLKRKQEINQQLNQSLQRIEHGFSLVTDKEIVANVYDIINCVKQLRHDFAAADTASFNNHIEFATKTSENLLLLLNKVKYWQELSNILLDKQALLGEVAIGTILKNTIDEISGKYNRVNDTIINEIIEVSLAINASLIEKLLKELLDNAFKFTIAGQPVIITTLISDKKYKIMIADSGNNVSAQLLSKIEAFSISDKGPGLGIAIADIILKSVGGTLHFQDNAPSGILVTITLPIQDAIHGIDMSLTPLLKKYMYN